MRKNVTVELPEHTLEALHDVGALIADQRPDLQPFLSDDFLMDAGIILLHILLCRNTLETFPLSTVIAAAFTSAMAHYPQQEKGQP